METPSWLASLKGWRTIIVAIVWGGFAAVIGAASAMDWSAPLHDWLPTLPGWLVGLIASFIYGALRVITTTPVGEKK